MKSKLRTYLSAKAERSVILRRNVSHTRIAIACLPNPVAGPVIPAAKSTGIRHLQDSETIETIAH
jgi:hypothetical protein